MCKVLSIMESLRRNGNTAKLAAEFAWGAGACGAAKEHQNPEYRYANRECSAVGIEISE